MGKWVFALKIILILGVFLFLGLLFFINPLSASNSFFKNPFADEVRIDTKNSFYDIERGRLRLVLDKEKGVNGNYISFSFEDEGITKDYFLKTQLIRDESVFYFDVGRCLGDFETVSVSINNNVESSYFTKKVSIHRGSVLGNNVYHNLCSFCEPGGEGSKDAPITLCTCESLQNISSRLDLHYELGGTIDCTNYSFSTIGDNFDPFTGSLDGNGNTIYGVVINEPNESYVGLFGVLYGGSIKNVGLRNATITGGVFVGGLVGRQEEGIISQSFVEQSSITGDANVGGLVGFSHGTIRDSYSQAMVTSLIFGGGLVGGCECTLTRTYFAGIVEAPYKGIVGNLLPDSKISSSYYDTDLLGSSGATGGEGLSTSLFEDEQSFTSWNFEKVWKVTNQSQYPVLRF